MEYLSTIILAIVQGITEWLPVSSSGHLVIFQHLLGLQSDILLDTALHVATLIAVIFVFRKKLLLMVKALFSWDTANIHFKHIWWLVLASVPIAVVGYLLQSVIEQAFTSLTFVGVTLLVTGLILYFTKYIKPTKKLTLKNALLIGLAQVIALLPGISRSGTTIATGLYQGVNREEAANFSFLLFIPAVLGAGVLQAASVDWTAASIGPLIVGMIVATVVGVIALTWFIGVIKKGKLNYFSWYCWGVGLLILVASVL